MTQKDGSPEASEGPYWSEELLAVLVVGLGDETQARDTLEGIIQQALSGKALQGISEEALASYLSNLYERIAESVQDSDVARRRSLTKKVEVVTEAARKAVAAAPPLPACVWHAVGSNSQSPIPSRFCGPCNARRELPVRPLPALEIAQGRLGTTPKQTRTTRASKRQNLRRGGTT